MKPAVDMAQELTVDIDLDDRLTCSDCAARAPLRACVCDELGNILCLSCGVAIMEARRLACLEVLKLASHRLAVGSPATIAQVQEAIAILVKRIEGGDRG